MSRRSKRKPPFHIITASDSNLVLGHINAPGYIDTNGGIFNPGTPNALRNVQNATIYSRIGVDVSNKHLVSIVEANRNLTSEFCAVMNDVFLVFSDTDESHKEHRRLIVETLCAYDIELDGKNSVFNVKTLKEAGFYMRLLDDASVFVILNNGLSEKSSE